ncbi:MAG: hypothetical protein KatS3mg077_1925 [Candidatus Binatia bacterium]|nr:MAG: hypothetical protein KatS3mg077_1925 [Candidatus Binatia bacterium]
MCCNCHGQVFSQRCLSKRTIRERYDQPCLLTRPVPCPQDKQKRSRSQSTCNPLSSYTKGVFPHGVPGGASKSARTQELDQVGGVNSRVIAAILPPSRGEGSAASGGDG